ncbi:hypothetical protein P9D31_17115 [Bacillus haynesii]|uniref:hypothetical protein n=1 Tax=Bacillus haynesii TaxID=1925021 RepID=UPI0022802CF7|nr:hypothetical protein [Bacillus haynesii]MCY8002446.1 hypothetical protein [Bacillus haynesii]MCY8242636.1 hypothetical protein [Bacillus haynesii]MEC1474056.1 hypothetical protein [Bacillus haynesii]MEC1485128.1 hypothetical protein [Bacillus haynesii]
MVFKEKNLPPQCPPADAVQKDVEPVYRFIENDTLQEIDFLNHRERNLTYRSEQECEALAISFYTTEQAAERLRKKFKRFKKKVLLKGKVTEECGIHKTENYHLNLWLFQDVNMLNVFPTE